MYLYQWILLVAVVWLFLNFIVGIIISTVLTFLVCVVLIKSTNTKTNVLVERRKK